MEEPSLDSVRAVIFWEDTPIRILRYSDSYTWTEAEYKVWFYLCHGDHWWSPVAKQFVDPKDAPPELRAQLLLINL